MVRLLVFAALVAALAGCQQETAEQQRAAQAIQEVRQFAEQQGGRLKAEKAAAAKAIADLQADPQKLKDFALVQVRQSVARMYGDGAAEQTTLTADAVEGYGGERWKVIGTLDGMDDAGERHQTEWEADLRFMAGKLQCWSVSLER
jgi:hypothetical protein